MGFTPLHVAVYRGSTTMVQMLLYYKADLLQVNVFDEPPVVFATGMCSIFSRSDFFKNIQ